LLATSTKPGACAPSYRWRSLTPSPRSASRSPMGKRTWPFGKWIGCATSLGNLRHRLSRDARETAAGRLRIVQSWQSKVLRAERAASRIRRPISALVHVMCPRAPIDGSPWLEGGDSNFRVVRGGSWRNEDDLIGATVRRERNINVAFDTLGFRVARKARSGG